MENTICLSLLLMMLSLLFPFAHAKASDNCAAVKQPPLPSSVEYAIEYQKQLYTWLSCHGYKKVSGVEVDKEVRQAGPFVALKDYGTHPAVRIWYSQEVIAWLKKGRPHTDGKASAEDLPDGAFIIKEMFTSPATIYNELAATPPFDDDAEGLAYEAMLESLLGSWVIMVKDRSGPSADGWYWGQAESNSNTVYKNPPNYNPAWLDNYMSTELDVYKARDGSGLIIPEPHFIYSGFSTGTCIRCHASSSSESTFSTLNNVDPEKENLQFRVDNSWRSKAYLDPVKATAPTLIDKITAFNKTITADGKLVTIDGKTIFEDYLKPIWYLPAAQRPWVDSNSTDLVDIRDAHLPQLEQKKDDEADKATAKPDADTGDSSNGINKDFVAAFVALANISQPSPAQIKRFSFPPTFADHSFSMQMNPGNLPVDHPSGPMTPGLQEYITSDNCVGCHGGLGGAPSGVSQFLQTGAGYGEGLNISPYGEWRWSPMGLAGRDPIFHSQIESEMLILLQENGLLGKQVNADQESVKKVHEVQQAVVDTCLRCHGAMGLRQKGLDQSESTINQHSVNHSQSKDAIQQWLTKKDQKLINPQFDLNNFYRTVPPSAETKSFKPWPNAPAPIPATSEFSDELGNLAREGISCTVCHHIAPPDEAAVAGFIETAKANHPDWITTDGQIWTNEFFTFMAANNTGLYERSEKDQILGPFEDVIEKPMQHALALTPQLAPDFNLGTVDPDDRTASTAEPFTKDSAMCGTCHSINLPNIGESLANEKNPILRLLQPNPVFQDLPHSIEQATYLEWLNSDFGPGLNNEKGKDFQSCQDCHMPNRSPLAAPDGDAPLAAQIATIQDANYPYADFQLPSEEIDVPVRADYRRHELVGMNGFMLEMFRQHPDVLNVNLKDIETYSDNGADLALDNMARSATENRVATIAVGEPQIDESGENLVVNVSIKNNTGHRFPSGVAFRRVWIELLVKEKGGAVLWASGRSNNAGIIVGPDGKQLPTEFLQDPNVYQDHYQEICSQDRVQIYEELVKNKAGEFTTSFVHRVTHIKDNRLLPRGWVPGDVFAGGVAGSGDLKNQGELLREMMRATDPDGVGDDPDFNQSPGGDSLRYRIPLAKADGAAKIEATIYSQALTPAWLWDRFSMANTAKQAGYDTPATDRLYFLASTLDLTKPLYKGKPQEQENPMKGWKFEVNSSEVNIPAILKISTVPAQCNKPYPGTHAKHTAQVSANDQ